MTLSLRYSYYSPYQDKLSLIFWSRFMMSFLSFIMTSYPYQPIADSPLISYHTIQLCIRVQYQYVQTVLETI